MRKLVVLGMGVCLVLAFASCKSSESAYKKAYEKAKQQELSRRKIVRFLPLTQGIAMMKNAFLSVNAESVLLPVCVIPGLTALCTVLSVRFFRRE